jgi:hypothetical protein
VRCAFDERCIPLGIQALFAGKRGAHQVVRAEPSCPLRSCWLSVAGLRRRPSGALPSAAESSLLESSAVPTAPLSSRVAIISDVPDILLAPYLPVSQQVRVGAWDLVPFDGIDRARVVPDDLVRPVTRLVTAYRPESRQGQAMGVVAVPEGGHVGTPFDRSAMRRLGYALVAGVVAGNPPMAVSEEDQEPNASWAVASAENALLYGHPLSEAGFHSEQ